MHYTRTEQKQLSFRGEQLLRGRHRVHPYPAMLHPLLVDSLIERYGKSGDVIFDPFCGSGVTLLQSGFHGHSSIGFDINPMALLIARAKTQSYKKELLIEEFEDLKKTLSRQNARSDIPQIKNRDYWYSKEVANDLGKVRWALKNKEYKYRDFFMTNFAFVCRNQSFTRNGEFKRYRIKADKMANAKNEVFSKFFSHVEDMIEIFLESDVPRAKSKPMLVNSENEIPSKIKYDMVITSPPYGDSRTTVAYGQYTSFGSEWVNGLSLQSSSGYQVDKEGLGVKRPPNKELNNHRTLVGHPQKNQENR